MSHVCKIIILSMSPGGNQLMPREHLRLRHPYVLQQESHYPLKMSLSHLSLGYLSLSDLNGLNLHSD